MKDSEVTKARGKELKTLPHELDEIVIEKVTRFYRVGSSSSVLLDNDDAHARKIPLSLPRVKWLERPDV
jgi:hypothetical protein